MSPGARESPLDTTNDGDGLGNQSGPQMFPDLRNEKEPRGARRDT